MSFLREHVFSTDHKVIARQFLWLGLGMLLVGGTMAMAIRWQLAYPGSPVPLVGKILFPSSGGIVSPAQYTALFTNHGTIMIFFAVTPLLIGAFGNLCIPLMIGAPDMIFPTLNMLSFWMFVLASAVLVGSWFAPMGPGAAGWTAYPPLSANTGTVGWGQTGLALAVFFAGIATIMGAINYITTVIRLRAPGMTWFRLPFTVWGLWLTSILNAIFVPVLGAGLLLLTLDRVAGTRFFVAGAFIKGGGDPILFQHLFWIFGHPEVYILILPVWGIVSDLLAFFARKPAFGYRVTAISLIAVTVLSAIVYGHHMFVTGMSPLLGKGFMVLTMIISVPAAALFINWLGTLWRGAMRLDTPMLFALGVVFVFGLGGLTGLFLANISADLYLHDSYFVVGHFHLTMAAAVVLGGFAGLYFWFPKMFGRLLDERLGKIHFWLSFVTINLVFLLMLAVGWAGMQRRLYNAGEYRFLAHLAPLSKMASHVAFTLFASQLVFVVNFFASLAQGAKAEANPWGVGTLEWTVPSPPPPHNFHETPVVKCGPHELSHPAARARGRDFLLQTEDVSDGDPAAPATSTKEGRSA